jgi:predicted O-methyltransferase YrrM
MSYNYPDHFVYPEDKKIFFKDHIELWDRALEQLKNKPNICLEIGALYGGSSVYILENLCSVEESHHYIMDINTNDYIEKNIEPYKDKVTYLLGESADSFKNFNHQGQTKEFLDFVYIDGNHLSKYVLEDAVNSFYCLKNQGIMIFDDYGGGWEQPQHMIVKTAVESFIHSYRKYLHVFYVGYQCVIQKITYLDENEMKENYYK